MLISYAQNFEDVILLRALHDVNKGFYVDIGANDPINDSVSFLFHERGWRGLHVEASPHFAERLKEARPDDVTIQRFVSSSSAPIHFYDFPGTGLGTSDAKLARRYKADGHEMVEVDVDAISLDEIFNSYCDNDIHWLKIDVEGAEEDVLASWSQADKRPWIIVIEATAPQSQTATHEKWEHLIKSKGYDFVYFDGINRFYIHDSRSSLRDAFGPGPNLFDGQLLTGRQTQPVPATIVAALKKDVDFFRQENERREQALIALRNEYTVTVQALTEISAEAECKEQALEELRQKAADKAGILERASEEAERKEQTLAALRLEVEDKTASHERLRHEVEQAEQALILLRGEVQEKSNDLESMGRDAESFKKTIEILRSENRYKNVSMKALSNNLKELQYLLANNLSDLNSKTRLISTIQKEAAKQNEIKSALRDELAITEQTRFRLDKTITKYEETISDIKRTIAEKNTLFVELEHKNLELKQGAVEKELQLAAMHTTLEEQQRFLIDLHSEIATRDSKLFENQTSMDVLTATVAALQNQVEVLESHISAINSSTSWRVTAPIRGIGRVVRWPERAAKRVTVRFLEASLHWLARRPVLKRFLIGLTTLVPPLRLRLTRFAHSRGYGLSLPVSPQSFRPVLQPEISALSAWESLLDIPRSKQHRRGQ